MTSPEKKEHKGLAMPPLYQGPMPSPSPTLADVERFLDQIQRPHSHGIVQSPRQLGKTTTLQEWQLKLLHQVLKVDQDYIDAMFYAGRYREPLEERTRYQNARPESFISPELTSRIMHWCHQDERVDRFWSMITGRIRSGLNDTIVDGIFQALAYLLNQWDDMLGDAKHRAKEETAGLALAAHAVVTAYEDALARGDLAYMREVIEELDAATYDIEES